MTRITGSCRIINGELFYNLPQIKAGVVSSVGRSFIKPVLVRSEIVNLQKSLSERLIDDWVIFKTEKELHETLAMDTLKDPFFFLIHEQRFKASFLQASLLIDSIRLVLAKHIDSFFQLNPFYLKPIKNHYSSCTLEPGKQLDLQRIYSIFNQCFKSLESPKVWTELARVYERFFSTNVVQNLDSDTEFALGIDFLKQEVSKTVQSPNNVCDGFTQQVPLFIL